MPLSWSLRRAACAGRKQSRNQSQTRAVMPRVTLPPRVSRQLVVLGIRLERYTLCTAGYVLHSDQIRSQREREGESVGRGGCTCQEPSTGQYIAR